MSETTERLHYLNQSGQPYGSTSRKCDWCGRMIWPGMQGSAKRWVESFEEWNNAKDKCSDWT